MWLRVMFCTLIAAALGADAFAQCRVEGIVRQFDGTPVSAATVVFQAQNLKTLTDEAGAYFFEGVKAGEYHRFSVLVNGQLVAEKVALVSLRIERVDITLDPPKGALISAPTRGGVAAAGTRRPPESEFVMMTSADSPGAASGVVRTADGVSVSGAKVGIDGTTVSVMTDIDGRYSLVGLRPGVRLVLVASAAGFDSATAAVLVPKGGASIEANFALQLASTGSGTGWTGGVRGVVRSADGLSVPGASVAIDGTNVFATTDTEGRYALVGLRLDAHLVLVASAPGFDSATVAVVVPKGGAPSEANFVLPLAAYSEDVTVSAEVPMLSVSGRASRVTLRPEQVVSLPSLGEKDIFRALQLLPGVTGSQEASSGLYVRGGTPDQNLVSFDGFTLYHVEHLFGYFSAFNMDAVDHVEFSKSAFNAADGGRLSGVLRLTGKSKAASGPTGFLNVSMLSAGGLFSTPLGTRGSFLIAGRRSFQSPLYNNIQGLFSTGGGLGRPGGGGPSGGAGPFGGGMFSTTPTSWFYDLNSKLDLKVTKSDRFSASVYDGRDELDNSRSLDLSGFGFRGFPGQEETTTDLPSDLVMDLTDLQHWRNRGMGATWRHQWASEATTTLSVGSSRYRNDRQNSSSLTSASTGESYSIAAGRGGSGGQAESNELRDLTLRLDNAVSAGSGHRLSFGAESTNLDIAYNAQTEALQGMGPAGGFNSGLVGLLNQSGSGRLLTGYAQDTWTPTARLVLSPGVRVTGYDLTGDTFVEPHFSINYQVSSRLQFKGGFGLYHQVANRIQREDLSQGDREFWTLANDTSVPVTSSRQVVFGGSYETPGFLLDVEAYHKTLNDLTLFAPRLTPGVIPDEGTSYLHQGSGKARGLEVLFQKKFGNQTGWVSYTLSSVQETFPTLEPESFPASYDQRHELKVADSIRVAKRWTIGGSWIFGSGRPYTPAVGVESVELPGIGITVDRLTFGTKNSARLPTYHRLDVSTQGEFTLFGAKSTLGVTIFNVYDRKNVWYRSYQTFGGSGSVNDVTLMGRAINVFFRFGF